MKTMHQHEENNNKRRTSAGRFYTSSAGARASLILMLAVCMWAWWVIGHAYPVAATASTLTVSIADSIALNIAPTSADGNFSTSSTSDTTVSVKTNNYTGYTLGIAASVANNNALTCTGCSRTGADTTISSISARVSGDDFADDANKTTYNNTWGYRPSKYNSVDNTTTNYYYPGPTSTTADTLDATSVANPTTANTYNIAVGARVDYAKEAGSYENTFVITVVANPTLYSITYNKNTTDTVANMPTNIVNGSADEENVTLSSNVPTRTGYEFVGWNTSADGTGTTYTAGSNWTINQTAASNTLTLYAMWNKVCSAGYICYDGNGGDDTILGTMNDQNVGTSATSAMLIAYNYKRLTDDNGTPRVNYAFLGWSENPDAVIGTDTIYGPMEDIAFSTQKSGATTLASKGLTLYAVWVPKSATYTMQNFSSSVCSSQLTQIKYDSTNDKFYTDGQSTLTAASFIALEDTRDHDVYMVARLTDGNCWMLENLRLNESATNVTTLSQGVGGSFTGLATSEDANFSNSTTSNSLYNTGNGYTMPRYNRNNTNIGGKNVAGTDLVASYNANNATAQWYGYGNYYTWAAAKANTEAMTSVSVSNSTTTSICPTNWRLPIGNNSTVTYSYGALSTSMGGTSAAMNTSSTPTGAVMSARIRHFPNNFVYSGSWNGTSAGNRSTYGYYWSSTAYSSSLAYNLRFYSSNVRPGTYNDYKYVGYSVRCVAGS